MASALARTAARAASLARARALTPASVHTASQAVHEQPAGVSPDVYAREEHREWESSDRESRFPKTVSVPEGGPRVSFPDYPTIMRHSLTEPFYGSFGHSLREPAYEFVPKRHLSSNRAPPGAPSRRRRAAPQPAEDDGCNEFGQSPAVWHLG